MIHRTLGVWAAVGLAGMAACAGPSALDRAEAAYAAGDYDGGIVAATQSIDQDGAPVGAYLVRGKCYDRKGDFDRAINDYGQAKQADPAQGEPAIRLVHCYLQAGRPADASTLADEMLRDRYSGYSLRDQMLTHAVRGEVSMAVQDYPSASDALGQALKVARQSRPLGAEPTTAVVYYNLSRAQFEQGAFKASRDAFQSYLDVARNAGTAPEEKDLYTLAVLQFLAGDIPECKKISASLGPESRARLEGILAGDTFSVKALYELKHKREATDAAAETNP